MKPVCVPCQRFFTPIKNGFYFIEGAPVGNNVEPGTSQRDRWRPYKVWVGDKYECMGCGAQIVSGFGSQHIAEHCQKDFADTVERLGADQLQVNDC